jgi:hypothetical protein
MKRAFKIISNIMLYAFAFIGFSAVALVLLMWHLESLGCIRTGIC